MTWSTKERALDVLARREWHKPPRPRKVGARILALLRRTRAALTFPEIGARAFIPDERAHSALLQLLRDGKVVRSGPRGAYRYSLPEACARPLPQFDSLAITGSLQPASVGVVMLLDQQRRAA